MKITYNINKIFFAILFLLSMFIGSIRLPIGPIRLDLLFDIFIIFYLLFIYKKINLKILKQALPFGLFIVYFIIHYLFIMQSPNLRDFLFIVIPIYTIITYYILNFLLKDIDIIVINKFIQFFMWVNFCFVIIQYTNLLGLSTLLKPYYEYLAVNNANSLIQALVLTQRPFGLVGNPTLLTFIIYVLYKISNKIKPNNLTTVISFFTMIISGGKMVLFFVILWEAYEFIYNKLKKIKSANELFFKILQIIVFLILGLFSILLIVYCVPFLKQFVWDTIAKGELFDGYSYTYRFSMYNILKKIEISTIFLGGYSYTVLTGMNIAYFDTEYVMRILQYGVIGLFLLFYPLIHFYYKSKYSIDNLYILAICLTFSLTNFTVSNYVLIFYIVFYLTIIKKINNKNLERQYKKE